MRCVAQTQTGSVSYVFSGVLASIDPDKELVRGSAVQDRGFTRLSPRDSAAVSPVKRMYVVLAFTCSLLLVFVFLSSSMLPT